ncbi:MAG: metallophosphoesterase [Saprospiraceae bacterium]
MKIFSFVIFILLLSGTSYCQLIYPGSVWRYYDAGMEPPLQSGVTWYQSSYDASLWNMGPAQLGYGDGDEATVISSATLTAYFRQSFTVNDVGDYSGLNLQLTYDDGAVVYLNGVEMWRVNMPAGNITYNTFASSSSGDNAMASITAPNTLVNGTNVLAVEIHQHAANSSDISFDFNLSGVPAAGIAVITRGPYLQRANDTSIIVRWRTNIASPSIIDYGPNVSSLTISAIEMTPVTEHILMIDSLSAASLYFYQLRNLTDTILFPAPDVYFKTYPAPGSVAPLTAWILGDCGTGNINARNVRNAYYSYIGTQRTDLMLFLGDNAYNSGTDAEYQTAVYQNMYEEKLKNTISWSCLGNHDGISSNSSTQTGPYYDMYSFPTLGECGGEASGTEAYYSFDFGAVHFIILNSYDVDRSVGGPMYQWCEADLANTNATWIIAAWHHSAYSKGSHDSDTDTYMTQMRQNFLPLLESYGVDLVLSGHSHAYERTYLLNGHYGLSSTFNLQTNTVGVTGSGSGQISNDGAYYKAPVGSQSGKGAVYITTGSSGQIQAAPLGHPAMYYNAISLGSCVLKINADTLSVIFLRQTGAIDDQFTIIKNPDCNPGVACDDLNPCTTNDKWDNYCYCHGVPFQRIVTSTADAGPGSMREIISSACAGDTIRFSATITDTIFLSSEITIDKNLVILGLSAQDIVMSGQLITRIFHVLPLTHLTISNITLCKGYQFTNGGAILNDGSLILEHTQFIANMQGAIPKAWTNHNQVLIKQGINYIRP